MPFKSMKQERFANTPAGKKAMGKDVVSEFNQASKGKKLPERPTAPKGKPLINISEMMKRK